MLGWPAEEVTCVPRVTWAQGMRQRVLQGGLKAAFSVFHRKKDLLPKLTMLTCSLEKKPSESHCVTCQRNFSGVKEIRIDK